MIVHYGREELCLTSLKSLLDSTGVKVLPVIVDNNPAPLTALEQLVMAAGGLYLNRPENLGYAAGANLGIRSIREKAPELITLLNPDVRLAPDCLETLRAYLEAHREIGVAGPGLLSETKPETWWNVGSEIVWPEGKPGSLLSGMLCEKGALEPRDVLFVCGSVLAFRLEVIEAIGYLPEEYFLYFEDADFCFRARALGLKAVVVPRALAWHQGGGSSEGLQPLTAYYRARNRLLFSSAWNPHPFLGSVHRVAFLLGTSLKALGRYLSSLDRSELSPTLGTFDYLLGRRGKSSRF